MSGPANERLIKEETGLLSTATRCNVLKLIKVDQIQITRTFTQSDFRMRCTVGFFLLATTICGVLAQDRNATTGALSLPNPKVKF